MAGGKAYFAKFYTNSVHNTDEFLQAIVRAHPNAPLYTVARIKATVPGNTKDPNDNAMLLDVANTLKSR